MSISSIDPALVQAFAKVGGNADRAASCVEALRAFEARMDWREFDVRSELTERLLSLLFPDQHRVYEKATACGLNIAYTIASKIGRHFMLSGELPACVWEPQTTKLISHLARRAKFSAFGGAYIGDQALFCAQAQGNAGKTYAFEPDQVSFDLLLRNIAQNACTNVIACREIIWAQSGVELVLAGDETLQGAREGASGGETFLTTTLSERLSEVASNELGLIAIDVEGGEEMILRGAERFLRDDSAPAIVFEVHGKYVDWSNGLLSTSIAQYLLGFGYKLHAIRDCQANYNLAGCPIEFVDPVSAVLSGPPHGFNMLALKDSSRLDGLDVQFVGDVSPKLLRHRSAEMHAPLHAPPGWHW